MRCLQRPDMLLRALQTHLHIIAIPQIKHGHCPHLTLGPARHGEITDPMEQMLLCNPHCQYGCPGRDR